jgi:peptidoglycan/xylan/chitin deacetylase (PgdA/CDA1 family)
LGKVGHAAKWLGSAAGLVLVVGVLLWVVFGADVARSSTPVPSGEQALRDARKLPGGFWQSAVEQAHDALNAVRAQTKAEMAHGVSTAKFQRGDHTKRLVAFTFDDGPHPGKTEPLLAVLRQNNVKATFFVVGMMAEKYPYLLRQEEAEGHEVGNHTYHHVNLTKIQPNLVQTEIRACDEVIRGVLGHGAMLLRPPGGNYNAKTVELTREVGYTTVLWTDDPGDYDSPGAEIILQRTLRDVSNGGIILLHDGIDQTIAILPRLIRWLRAKGYEIVTAGELIRRTQA